MDARVELVDVEEPQPGPGEVRVKVAVSAINPKGGTQLVTSKTPVQTQLDAILPFMLPVLLTAVVYWLLKRYNLNPLWAIAFVFVIGIVLGGLGWFAPALPVAAAK